MPSGETVQLDIKNASARAQRVVQTELALIRQNSNLPSVKNKQASTTLLQKVAEGRYGEVPKQSEDWNDKLRLPRLNAKLRGKFDAARNNALIMGAIGHPEIEKMKQQVELKRKKQQQIRAMHMNVEVKKNSRKLDKTASQELKLSSGAESMRPSLSASISTPSAFGSPARGQSPQRQSKFSPERNRPTHSAPAGELQRSRSSMTFSSRRSTRTSLTLQRRRQSRTAMSSMSGVGVRDDSRVGKLVSEFGSTPDWVSNVILRHQLATIIQANVRGWLLRLRWNRNPVDVVVDLHEKLETARMSESVRAARRKELENRVLTSKQKAAANDIMTKLFSSKMKKDDGPPVKWGRVKRNMDLVKEKQADLVKNGGLDSGSDFEDLEVDNIAAVKFRATTPPWQNVDTARWSGQYARLTVKPQRGQVDVIWDLSGTASKIEEVKMRRLQRDHKAHLQEANRMAHPESEPLPPDLVNNLLLDRYIEKYTRLGLTNRMPTKDAELMASFASAVTLLNARMEDQSVFSSRGRQKSSDGKFQSVDGQ